MLAGKLAPLAEPALGAAEGASLAAGLAAGVVAISDVLQHNWVPVIATGALLGLAKWGGDALTGGDASKDDTSSLLGSLKKDE